MEITNAESRVEITVTELRRHLKKYLDLSQSERVYVICQGKVVAIISNPYEDRVKVMKDLFGCIPADITLEESIEEHRSKI
ncbi:MAG: type II toxin-antitoxin system prevent-host-death family antitoxin [Clostridia bacterium]|nr:type II toxin-antitoxin system prevent-host-death family antitoxin [Clostridia bacterium]